MSRTKTTTTTTRRRTRNRTTNVWNQLLNLSSSLDEQDDTNNTADAHWSWLDQKRPASPQRTARTKRPHQRIIVRTKRALEEQARYGISNALVLTTLQQGMILIGQRPLELQQDDDEEDDESSLEHDDSNHEDDDEHDFPELQAPCQYDPTSTKKKPSSSPLRNTSTLESNLCFRYENLDTGTVVLVQEYPADHSPGSPSRGSPHRRRRNRHSGGSPHRMRHNEESNAVVVRVLNVYPLHAAATDPFEPSVPHGTSHNNQEHDEETEWMWDQEQDPSLNNKDHSTSASVRDSHMQQEQQQLSSSLSPTYRRNAAAAVVVERHEEEEPDWYRDPNDDSDDDEEEEESLDPNGDHPYDGVDVQPANGGEPVSPPRRQRQAEHWPLLERNDRQGLIHPQPLMEEEPALRPLVQDHQDPDVPANRPQHENHVPLAARPADRSRRVHHPEEEENPEWTSPPSPLRPRPPPPQQQQDRLQEHQVRGRRDQSATTTRHANGRQQRRQQVPDAQGSLEESLLIYDHETEEDETVEDLLGSVTTTSRDEDDDATQQLVLAMLGVVAVVGLWLVAGEATPSSLW